MLPSQDYMRQRAPASPDDCWVWSLYVNSDGYGTLTFAGRHGLLAHRVMYELSAGLIPEGITVDHVCFNRACVNPDHLRLLSHSENAGNQRSSYLTECVKGHLFDDRNTYLRPASSRNGRRSCRTCNREAVARYRERKVA